MLIEEFMEDCVIMDRITTSDGQGGMISSWIEGAEIKCAIVPKSSIASQVADAIRNTATYQITTKKSNNLEFYQVIKRLSDGETFRIRSGAKDGDFPKVASSMINQYTQYDAERWELTS